MSEIDLLGLVVEQLGRHLTFDLGGPVRNVPESQGFGKGGSAC